MTHARRRHPKPGSHLAPIKAESLIRHDTILRILHESLLKGGFSLSPTIRPYLRKDRRVTLRFVWRQRGDQESCVFNYTELLPLSDILVARERG